MGLRMGFDLRAPAAKALALAAPILCAIVLIPPVLMALVGDTQGIAEWGAARIERAAKKEAFFVVAAMFVALGTALGGLAALILAAARSLTR